MDLYKQIITLLTSLLYGFVFYLFTYLNKRIIYNKNKIIKILGNFLIVLIATLLYFIILEKINNGIYHYYSLICLLIGFLSSLIIVNMLKKWYTFFKIEGGKVAKKKKQRKMRWLSVLAIVAFSYLAYTFVTSSIQVYKLHKEESEAKEELKKLKGHSQELKIEINKLQDKDYVARYARENYLYTKDGEYVIKVDPKKTKKTKNKYEIDKKYIIYGCIGIFLLLIIFVLLKRKKKKKRK